MDPYGHLLSNDSRYTLINDERGVRLDFSEANFMDQGVWRCKLRVEGRNIKANNSLTNFVVVGERTISINLTLNGKSMQR